MRWAPRAGTRRSISFSTPLARCLGTDTRNAILEILEMTDAKAFLTKSGCFPGIELE
jgi:hypothetical protein